MFMGLQWGLWLGELRQPWVLSGTRMDRITSNTSFSTMLLGQVSALESSDGFSNSRPITKVSVASPRFLVGLLPGHWMGP